MDLEDLFKDFSSEFSQAIEQGLPTKEEFIEKKYKGDPTLDYSISKEIVKISPKVIYEQLGGQNTLEYISSYSQSLKSEGCLAMEIAFSALIDESSLKIIQVIVGEVGNSGECDIDAGVLLKNSYAAAEKTKTKVSLGHTHPVFTLENGLADPKRTYGAIPSLIPYTSKKQVKASFRNNEKLANEIIRTEIYKQYRGDYVELYMRPQLEPLISNYAMILSPVLKQLGIFEVKEKGVIVYHPWIVSD